MLAIETHDLRKTFPPPLRLPLVAQRGRAAVTAVDGVDLTLESGTLLTLLGPNGAGKTTLIKLLSTLIVPTAGTARVLGHDLRDTQAIKAAVGLVVADERSFHWRLSARQNLRFFAALHDLDGAAAERRIDEALGQVGLGDVADDRFQTYSTGMRQRLAIARGLLHRPRLLFLDEPTRSLDPRGTRELHTLVRALVAGGTSVLLTTHDLVEAEVLSERVAVMHRGRIRVSAPPGELRRRLRPGERYTLSVDALPAEARARLAALVGALRVEPDGPQRLTLTFETDGAAGTFTAVVDVLRAHGVQLLGAHNELPTLEEVFEHFTEGA
jgi:ABC-2 type transport system ATP-binding protein